MLPQLALVAATLVHWEGSPHLAAVVAGSDAMADLVSYDGYRPAETPASVRCDARVTRPASTTDAGITDPSAALWCAATYQDGAVGTWRVSLARTPVLAWGNRFDRHKPFYFEGPVARGLFQSLADARAADTLGPLLSWSGVCGPDGRVCIELIALFRRSADESPASLVCSREWEDGVVVGVDCVFHPLP